MADLHPFIISVPVNQSHYTRGKAPMRQYMERCTVKELWQVYSSQREANEEQHVSYHTFLSVLNYSYNISQWSLFLTISEII